MDKFEITFGHLIAYLIPGFIALYPLAHYIPAVASLVGTNGVPQAEALLPLVILGLAVGIVINAFSWALLRPIFALSGVKRPESLNYTGLRKDDLDIY